MSFNVLHDPFFGNAILPKPINVSDAVIKLGS
jgi:hypothetical protein